MAKLIKVARRAELKEGTATVVEVGDRLIAIFNAEGRFYAIDNACLHEGGPLGQGEIYGTRVVCPLHGWEYDLTTGACVDDATVKLACFAVRVEGDDVFVEI